MTHYLQKHSVGEHFDKSLLEGIKEEQSVVKKYFFLLLMFL